MERTLAASDTRPLPVLGAIVAGGASRRFGSPKALVRVGGTPLVERARRALAEAVAHPVLITHLAEIAASVALPTRADRSPGAGPLGGVEAALSWALELRLPGALCVACDLPFLPSSLLRAIAARGLDTGAMAVLPESAPDGRLEPLCAWYSTAALDFVREALQGADRSLGRAARALSAEPFPLTQVALHGDPDILFLNVNTPGGWREAERLAEGSPAHA